MSTLKINPIEEISQERLIRCVERLMEDPTNMRDYLNSLSSDELVTLICKLG